MTTVKPASEQNLLKDLSRQILERKIIIGRLMRIDEENADDRIIRCAEELKRRRQGLVPEYKSVLSDAELLEFHDDLCELDETIRGGLRARIGEYMDELGKLCIKKDLLRASLYRYKN